MTYSNLNDFNSASPQYELIPAHTILKVSLLIKPGGSGPEGWMTESLSSKAVYLKADLTVLEGPYAKRKLYTLIGIKGNKTGGDGDDMWANMGRAVIRAILESARNINPRDESPTAAQGRRINSIGDLNGLKFAIKAGVEETPSHGARNKVASVITPDQADYAKVMGTSKSAASPATTSVPAWNR